MTASTGPKKKMNTRVIILIVVIVVALIASAGYYISSSNALCSNCVTENITIVGGVGANTTDTYSPDSFTVTQGQHVTLVVLNTDDNTHGLKIDAFNVDTGIIQSGSSARVQFVANQVGTFQYYEPPGYCTAGVGNVCNSVQEMMGEMMVVA